MIRFACTCHAVLEVSDDFAGTSLQCPRCKRLVDVPTLSDLASLDQDGTIKMDAEPVMDEPDRLQKLKRVYAKTRKDEHGNEIDLRERFGRDSQEDANEIFGLAEEHPAAPKYDPVTGELVRAVPLKNEPIKFDPATIPMAKAVINYASGEQLRVFSGWRIWAEIFKLQNIAVMGMILLMHIALQLVMIPMLGGFFIVFFGPLVLIMGLVAHYSNVVEEIGVQANNELPRPLRDLNWTDDIGGPFFNLATAVLVCYGAMAFWHRVPHGMQIAYLGTIAFIGTFLFPAVFLTTATSGTILNLSPERVLRVISAIGLRYVVAVGLWAVTGFVYVVGAWDALATLIKWMTSIKPPGSSVPFLIPYGMLLVGVVLMHGFCWYLGLLYRRYYDQFDWLLQRHHKTPQPIKPDLGMTAATPSKAPPVAKAIEAPQAGGVPPIARPSPRAAPRYPQSHA